MIGWVSVQKINTPVDAQQVCEIELIFRPAVRVILMCDCLLIYFVLIKLYLKTLIQTQNCTYIELMSLPVK